MSLTPHRPFYADMFRDAWVSAWRMRWAWVIALGAGTLQTGGIIDVLLRLIRERVVLLSPLETAPTSNFLANCYALILNADGAFNQLIMVAKLSQMFLLALLFGLAVLTFVVLCQGALVYLVGVRGRFTRPTLTEAFQAAGQSFWRVAALNCLPLGAYLLAWFIFLAPFGTLIQLTTVPAVLAYVLAVIAALVTGFIATSLHLLALQIVVLEAAHLEAALKATYVLFKRSWFTILETAVFIFAMNVALFMTALLIFTLLLLPLLAFVVIVSIFQMPLLGSVLILVCAILFLSIMLAAGGFMIVFQYTVWNRLSTRLNKNLAPSKLVRLAHHALNRLHRQ